VVTVHDLAWHTFPESTTSRGRRWHEAALRRALRRADALLVPSEAVAEELRASGAREGTVSVLQWGADHLPPPDGQGAADLLDRLGVGDQYLLSASTREPRKNLHRLVAAYSAARASLPEPWPLVIVGPRGWGDSELGIDSSRGSRVPEGVVAAGLVSDEVLAGLYAGARVFAYVPLTEGYGLPPLEAMTLGAPVVVSTGVPSVAPGPATPPAALRVDPLSIEAIADALVSAAGDEKLRSALVDRGSALARTRTWRRSARQHIELWESLE
jgi:glycosyltransferase involved in cell wall biosynthesis